MGGGGKEIKAAAADGCKSAQGKSRGAAGRDGSGKRSCGGDRCPRRAGTCASALPVLLSALAVASCVYLGVRTSDLQARVAAIEGARGGLSAAAPLPPLPGFSLEQLNAMMQEKVERLLAQRSYEHLAKIRVAREASPECNCPPGPLVVFAGIKDLKLMKTTQSGFEGFYKNEHTTLPERKDRILCGELFCKWSYGECTDLDFDCIWNKIRECILEAFSGPPDCGEYSPSYQKTVNSIQMFILSKVSQVQIIETVLNNTFYDVLDMKNLGMTNDKEVLIPVENPHGFCSCTLGRKKFLEAQGRMLKDERQSQFGLGAAQGN